MTSIENESSIKNSCEYGSKRNWENLFRKFSPKLYNAWFLSYVTWRYLHILLLFVAVNPSLSWISTFGRYSKLNHLHRATTKSSGWRKKIDGKFRWVLTEKYWSKIYFDSFSLTSVSKERSHKSQESKEFVNWVSTGDIFDLKSKGFNTDHVI